MNENTTKPVLLQVSYVVVPHDPDAEVQRLLVFHNDRAGTMLDHDYIEVVVGDGTLHIYPDGAVLLFAPGETQGTYLRR